MSKYQGKINWKKVKSSGVDFAIIRAGLTWYEGGLVVDPSFKYNIENAIANKIDVGIYVYSYDRSVEAAKIAATKVLALIKPYKLTMPVVFDMEYEKFNKTVGKGKRNTDICIAFLEEIEKAGYYAMLYCSTDFFHNYLELDRLDRYDKWCAQYAKKCTLRKPYGIWQYTSKGKVSGIRGRVDMNIGYKDYPALLKKPALTPTPPIKPKEKRWQLEIRHFTQRKDAQNIQQLLELVKLYSEVKEGVQGGFWVLSYSYGEKKAKEVSQAIELLTGLKCEIKEMV